MSEQHRRRTKKSFALCAVLLALAAACGGKQPVAPTETVGNDQPVEQPAPPAPADCHAVGQKIAADARARMPRGDLPPEAQAQIEEMTNTLVGLVVTSCEEDNWSDEAIRCGLTATDPEAACDDKLSLEQKQKLQDRMMKAMGEFEGSVTVAGSSGIPECDAYVAAMDKYMACEKVPQSARDDAKQGLDAATHGWANVDQMTEDDKKRVADGCKRAIHALEQGASAMGCPL